MINRSEHPVAWALLLYQIDDVREHLESLANAMASAGRIEDDSFEVQIAHAYAHLNRIWHSRNHESDETSDEQRKAFSEFPTDEAEPRVRWFHQGMSKLTPAWAIVFVALAGVAVQIPSQRYREAAPSHPCTLIALQY